MIEGLSDLVLSIVALAMFAVGIVLAAGVLWLASAVLS